ncbi:HAD family phosphatase [Vibrio sp. JC009]|uniref:HAD family hydrolase n=1 Tax=Vibrio sp. JC009 TaxID=2912314 RepID=UPI0023B11CE3|nr:HAD family phosphatase [Vibrio sp. JC009]WED24505.1 HAD family phosphatase [Vibrio sp. JC009]
MFKALLFDMDGLIFDTEGLYKKAWQRAAGDQGLDLNDEFYQNFIGVQDPACEQLMVSHFGERLNLPLFQKQRDQYVKELKQKPVPYKPGFKDLFETAKEQNIKCALVTSSFLKDVEHHFADSGYLEQFDTLITAEKVTNGKPAPDCYLMACSELKIAPETCLVLEDSNNGMQSGLDAGCSAAMIPDLLPPREDIKERATHIFASLEDVLSLVK